MKVVRCNDETYSLILQHAAQRGCNITRAVDELVTAQLSSGPIARAVDELVGGRPEEDIQLGAVADPGVQEILAKVEELHRYIGKELGGILANAVLDISSICRKLELETSWSKKGRKP